MFAQLDLRMGYHHQLELDPESKCLLLGVKSAAEQFLYAVQTALTGIVGVENISDDIMQNYTTSYYVTFFIVCREVVSHLMQLSVCTT